MPLNLNDTGEQQPEFQPFDLDEIKRKLAARAGEIYPRLFPKGVIDKRRRELHLANTHGDAPHGDGSCVVELNGEHAGCIRDWSTGEHGDQLYSVECATGLTGRALFERAAGLVGATPKGNGHDKPNGYGRRRRTDAETARDIAFILKHSEPAAGTLVETYLASRGLDLPECPDLLFHPSLTDWEAQRGRPAMVAIIRDPATGEPTGGIHRTWLADDGIGKAEMSKPKKALGPSFGVVMSRPISDDGVLGVGEGIETSIAGAKIFGVPAWAALNAGNLRRMRLPPKLKKLLIFADRGDDGVSAANELCQRALAAGIDTWIYLPHGLDDGADFNDDLKRGECRAKDYPASRPTPEPLPQPWMIAPVEPPNTAEPEILPPPRTAADLIAAAQTLTKDSPEMQQVLKACVPLNPLERSRVLDELKKSTRYGLIKLEQMVKSYRKEAGYLSRNAGPRPAWVDKLKLWDNGEPQPIQFNVAVALREDPTWRGVIGRDEFTGRIRVRRCPPWPNADWSQERDWTDDDTLKTTEWIQAVDICAPKSIVSDAVESVANENPFHPVRDWLDSLEWDGEPRLDRWLSDYCGGVESPYVRAVASRFPISAVARIYQPGVKVDCALIFEGKQGIGKSSALRMLFDGDSRGWFTDEIAELGSKDAAMQMAGIWCIELAELDAMRRAEVSRLKAFLTRTNDRYRPPYGRIVVDVPRQCVFAGTVNDSEYLRDPTGGRRFWPVKCGTIDIRGLCQARDQLFAEAVSRYRRGEKWFLHEKELIEDATEEQSARQLQHPWEEPIGEWLAKHTNKANGVTVGEILENALYKHTEHWTDADSQAVGKCMRALGYEPKQKRVGTGRERRYYPPALTL